MSLFVFVDESGDPGNNLEVGASSSYYSELALQINKENYRYFSEHIISWQYILGRFTEFKSLPSKTNELKRYLGPIIELCSGNGLCCSCVYLIKSNYTGPYFRDTQYSPLKFRNFVHRKLLEYHFICYPSSGDDIELVFDRYRMTKIEMDNVETYLRGNWNLPEFRYISHINSLFSGVMQLTSQLVGATKDIILKTADENKKELLSFIKMKDITVL